MDRATHYYYPWSAKHFLERRGLDISTTTRIPTKKLSAKDKYVFESLLKFFHETMNEFQVDTAV